MLVKIYGALFFIIFVLGLAFHVYSVKILYSMHGIFGLFGFFAPVLAWLYIAYKSWQMSGTFLTYYNIYFIGLFISVIVLNIIGYFKFEN